MEALSYCVAEQINLTTLEQKLKKMTTMTWNRHWNVIELFRVKQNQYCYFFKNGTIVSWNIKRHDMSEYLYLAQRNSINELETPITDEFSYQVTGRTNILPHEYFNVDLIHLENDDSESKLALSYGLSQSIKLNYYEQKLETLINSYNPSILQLASGGKFAVSRRNINKILGDILAAKSELNLTSNFLYQPKFYWLHPNLEYYYQMVEKYLDIPKRAESLNGQIDTLNEIFLMFNSYLENKRGHNLELIIILLIAVEIIFSVFNWHF